MFLKKLFGKSSTPAATPGAQKAPDVPAQNWRNPDWVTFSYPTRYGDEACQIEGDPFYEEASRRTDLLHCVRVLLPLPPAQQSLKAVLAEGAKAELKATENSLCRALERFAVRGMLVGKLNYEGWQEWVLMLSDRNGLQDAIATWIATTPRPGLQVWESEGWEYYDEHIALSPIDRINMLGEKRIAELVMQGTNTAVKHWLTHCFQGDAKALASLKAELDDQDFQTELTQHSRLLASKACMLTIADTQAVAASLQAAAKLWEATYEGWTTELIKERWIGAQVSTGTGEYLHKNGALYRGEWRNGIKHGKGWIRFNDGSLYEGDWLEGKRTGKGVLRWSKKEIYSGGFRDNELDGQGEYTYASGNQYSGGWDMGVRQGKGSFKWANGDSYIGDWDKDKRTGYGRINYAKPVEWYEGQFVNGELSGEGYDFYERQNRIRLAIWKETKVVEEKELTLPEGLLSWSGLTNAYYRDTINAHLESAVGSGRIPCIYWQRDNAPSSHYFRHYALLPVFADIFRAISVLEIPYDMADLPLIMGCPPDAMLIRVDPATQQATKWIQSPVWHELRFEHAHTHLRYIIE